MRRINKTRGFTLLELLVVLVILMLLSSAVAINIGGSLQEARLRAGSRMVIGMLRYARSYAVAQRADTMVEFDTERRGLDVQVQELDENGAAHWRPLTTPSGCFRQLPDAVEIVGVQTAGSQDNTNADTASQASTVSFSALGQASDTVITLRNDKGKQLAISLDALTGRCDLAESTDDK